MRISRLNVRASSAQSLRGLASALTQQRCALKCARKRSWMEGDARKETGVNETAWKIAGWDRCSGSFFFPFFFFFSSSATDEWSRPLDDNASLNVGIPDHSRSQAKTLAINIEAHLRWLNLLRNWAARDPGTRFRFQKKDLCEGKTRKGHYDARQLDRSPDLAITAVRKYLTGASAGQIRTLRFNLLLIAASGIFRLAWGAPRSKERASVSAGRYKMPELGFDEHQLVFCAPRCCRCTTHRLADYSRRAWRALSLYERRKQTHGNRVA